MTKEAVKLLGWLFSKGRASKGGGWFLFLFCEIY